MCKFSEYSLKQNLIIPCFICTNTVSNTSHTNSKFLLFLGWCRWVAYVSLRPFIEHVSSRLVGLGNPPGILPFSPCCQGRRVSNRLVIFTHDIPNLKSSILFKIAISENTLP